MRECEYYKLALRERISESKSRFITLLISTICWCIAGAQEQNGHAWFVTMLTIVAASFGASLFYPKDLPIKKVIYYMINIYSFGCLVIATLGVIGVIEINNGMIQFIQSGVYNGQRILRANTYFLGLIGILTLDLIGWMTCAMYDHRTKPDDNAK